MYGVFRLKPNDRNVRDLDIEVDVDFQVISYKVYLESLGFPRITQSVSTFKILLYILLLRGNCAKFLRRTNTRCDERSL